MRTGLSAVIGDLDAALREREHELVEGRGRRTRHVSQPEDVSQRAEDRRLEQLSLVHGAEVRDVYRVERDAERRAGDLDAASGERRDLALDHGVERGERPLPRLHENRSEGLP
jgi:hypothetical protein